MTVTHRRSVVAAAVGLAMLGMAASACGSSSGTGSSDSSPGAGSAATADSHPKGQDAEQSSDTPAGKEINCATDDASSAKVDQAAQCFYAASLNGNFKRASEFTFDPHVTDNYPALAALQTAPPASRQARFAGCTAVTSVPGLDAPADTAPQRCDFPYPGKTGQDRVNVYTIENSAGGNTVFATGFDGKAVPAQDTLPTVDYDQTG